MRTPRLPLFAALAALLLPFLATAAPTETPTRAEPSDEAVYVILESPDPLRFDRMRYSLVTGKELFLATLKISADAQARFAGYPGTVVVLDENARPPAGATILRLTWDGKIVSAEAIVAGKSKYLGVVNSLPIEHHPDYMRMQRSIASAGLPDARRDAALRAEIQMYLFKALQYLGRYQRSQAAKA